MDAGPRFPVADLVNVHLEVPSLEQGIAFYTEVWGLILAERGHGTAYLRGSGRDPYLLALSQADRVGVKSVGFRADPATDLGALRHQIERAGAREAEIGPLDTPGGGNALSYRDHRGRRFTIVQGDRLLDPVEDATPRPSRLAHVNINCSDVETDLAFYQQGLGFVITDRTAVMSFGRTNDDHHVIVLATETVDTLNHIAFLHDTLDGAMRASGLAVDAGYPIAWGPGRHGPGDNVFTYFIDPFGIVVEHTAEILKVDDSYRVGGPADWVWPPGRSDHWGIGKVKDEACKQAQRAIPFH